MFRMTRFKWFLLIDVLVIAIVCLLVVQPMPGAPQTSAPHNGADPARLAAHVRKLSLDSHPRSFDRPANLENPGRALR